MSVGRLVALGFVIAACIGCNGAPPVPVPGPGAIDTTPPLLRLGSAGLRKDLLLTQDSTAPQERRAKSTDDVFLLATATDSETGVRQVDVLGELRLVCIPSTGDRLVTIVDPIAETNTAPSGGDTLPGELARQFRLQVAPQRARCPRDTRFYELRLELKAEAENGVGQVRRLPAAVVSSFGPDIVRIGTFNLYRPGNHPDAVYVRWGQTLGRLADVLLLTEVEDRRRAEVMASAAGMPYVVVLRESDSDLAIASRAPLRDVQRRVIDPPSRLASNNSNILYAQTDLGGYPHQVVGTHWGIRDADDELFPPNRSSPSRLRAAETILELLVPPPAIGIVGGDLNAYSGLGPQDHDDDSSTPDFQGSTTEVDLLRGSLTD